MNLKLETLEDLPLILAYHSISSKRQDGLAVRTQDFAWQMRWLASRGYRAVTLSEWVRGDADKEKRVVLITFDDGYADNYTQAFPILQQYGFKATIFLVSDYVGQEHVYWWDQPKQRAGVDVALYYPLTWEQVFRMSEAGFEFGSHTRRHPKALTELSLEQRWVEISESRTDLRSKLGADVSSFCYPRGDLNPETMQMVADAGYECAVVTPPRVGIPITRYTLRRISLYREYGPTLFRVMVTPFFRRNYELFKRMRRVLLRGFNKQIQS